MIIIDSPEGFIPGNHEVYFTIDVSDKPLRDKEFRFLTSICLLTGQVVREAISQAPPEAFAFMMAEEPTRTDVFFFDRELNILRESK